MREPSPVVPCIVVAALGWFICGPTLLSILESYVAVGQTVAEIEGSAAFCILILLLLFLLLLIHLFSLFFPTLGISSFGVMQQQQPPNHPADVAADGFSFGFGTLLLVLLFVVLCHLF
ncbi:hypothetical protein I3843_02G038100 [Carya illinoinensis]|nr:hypothetical protein I3842_02G048300 [Carya illinoinensis]KAG7990713.1 hypothetical protein I3843_02G038100 [Carya illinoinensis]